MHRQSNRIERNLAEVQAFQKKALPMIVVHRVKGLGSQSCGMFSSGFGAPLTVHLGKQT